MPSFSRAARGSAAKSKIIKAIFRRQNGLRSQLLTHLRWFKRTLKCSPVLSLGKVLNFGLCLSTVAEIHGPALRTLRCEILHCQKIVKKVVQTPCKSSRRHSRIRPRYGGRTFREKFGSEIRSWNGSTAAVRVSSCLRHLWECRVLKNTSPKGLGMRMGNKFRIRGKWGMQILAATLTLVFLILSSAQHANALPAFARKYGLRCSACHESWPMLN